MIKISRNVKIFIVVVLAIAIALTVWWFFSYAFPTDVSIVSVGYSPTSSKGKVVGIAVKLKNNLAFPQKVYYEAGIVASGSQLSTFPLGITWGGKCCIGNENYDGKWVLLMPYEEFTDTLNPRMPSETSSDKCHNQGSYWKGTGTYYIGIAVTTACYGQPGWKVIDFETRTIQMI